MKKHFTQIVLFLFLAVAVVACVDQVFDEPPVADLPKIQANTTIDALKKKHTIGATASKINEDLIIEGVVVADDRSGNFFENIVIQDATGGISVRLNASNLYNKFPVGAKVAVRCKNLFIGDFNGVHQLSGSATDAIEELLIAQYLFVTGKDQPVAPRVLAIKDLNASHVNTLIKLENVEFAPADTNQTWADATRRLSLNRNLQDCSGGTIIVRSSGFADFANAKTPGKKGALTAIYTVFGTTKQLVIRDLNDVALTGVRCAGSGSGTGGTGQLISIADLRALFKGTTLTLPADRKIKGVVISDRVAGNTDPRNIVLQSGDAGVVVRFRNNHEFNLGQEIEVTVSGQELSEFNGLLQVNNIDNALAKLLGNGQLPSPRVASAAQITANLERWESTLVKILKGSFSASGTYSGSKTLTDSTGQVVVFTRSQATFSGSTLPTGRNLDLVGIVSQFNTVQVTPRNLTDITVSSGPVNTNNLLDESFSSGTANQPVKLNGWVNKAMTGTRTWTTKSFSGNLFAEATAFQSTDTENEMWLITPGIKADEAKVLTFESAQAFYKHDGLTVYVSNDFDGNDISKATWKKLTFKMPTASNANYDWVQSGNVDLSGYSGTIYIGFQLKGDKATNTTTFRIDNVKVSK